MSGAERDELVAWLMPLFERGLGAECLVSAPTVAERGVVLNAFMPDGESKCWPISWSALALTRDAVEGRVDAMQLAFGLTHGMG